MRYYILIRKKGSSRYVGAIPTKKGSTVAKIRRMLRKSLTRNYSAKIVSEMQLKRLVLKSRKKYRR